MEHLHCILFLFFMNVCQVEGQVLDPVGDDLSSTSEGDLGAALSLDEKESPWR